MTVKHVCLLCHAGKKGGALASAIHSHMQHGDPYVRSVIKHTLALVAQPIFSTITRWIYDGELDDNYNEVRHVHVMAHMTAHLTVGSVF